MSSDAPRPEGRLTVKEPFVTGSAPFCAVTVNILLPGVLSSSVMLRLALEAVALGDNVNTVLPP
ncbi:hypothetical protein D3C87_1925780 [compost metagenome]